MAFLDDLGDLVKPITDKSREVATKAKEITEALQIRNQINTEEQTLEEAYSSIGRTYYETRPDNSEEIFEDAYTLIKRCKNQISMLEDKLYQLTGSRICAHCGAKVDKDFGFCGKCGAPVEVYEEAQPVSPEPVYDQEVSVQAALEMKPVALLEGVKEAAAEEIINQEILEES